MAKSNRVKEARSVEAVSRAELAKKGGPSEQTIKRIEDGRRNVAPLTKDKIVRAFNNLDRKKQNYTREYLFPE